MAKGNKKLEGLVYTALDNALEGGYSETLFEHPYDQAVNLLGFDADVADEAARVKVGEKEIAEMVLAWQMHNQAALEKTERTAE